MNQQRTTRRSVLTAMLGAAVTGCGIAATPTTAPAPAPTPPAASSDDPDLAALERRFRGRLGVHALDTGTGATVSHRGSERFLMASTAKLPLAAAVLHRAAADPTPLDRLVRYFDRDEADLNVPTGPEDERDTTTPAAFVGTLRAVTLGASVDPAGRDRLTTWLIANTTGDNTIRAGVPARWVVGDETGTGARGERNDVGIVVGPDRAPLVQAVYTDPDDPDSTAGDATIAEATAIAVRRLGGR